MQDARDQQGNKGRSLKKLITPAARRGVVVYLEEDHHLSERRACTIVGLCRSSCRYQAIPKDDVEIRSRLRELAEERHKFGAPRLHIMLQWDGYQIKCLVP